jgi:hypothetical protein
MSHGTYSLKRRKKERRHDPEKILYINERRNAIKNIVLAWEGQRLGPPDTFDWRRGGVERRSGERRLIPLRPIMYTALAMDAEFCAIRQQYLEQPWNCQTFRSDQDKLTTTHAWRK